MPPERPTLALTSIDDDAIRYVLIDETGDVDRGVHVHISSGKAMFPAALSSESESTGDDELDAKIRRQANEEIVRLRAATCAARRFANGVRDELDAGYWEGA